MAVKIRLARHGKKGYPFYHIVVADSRSPRDGRFIEKIGTYNPNTNPASIELSFEKALNWMQKGAQPTDTCRNILSHKGVMMKKHLLEGVTKGAFTLEQAEVKFEAWAQKKDGQVATKVNQLASDKDAQEKARFAGEKKVKEDRTKAIEAKKVAAEAPVEEVSEETIAEEVVDAPQAVVDAEVAPVADQEVQA